MRLLDCVQLLVRDKLTGRPLRSANKHQPKKVPSNAVGVEGGEVGKGGPSWSPAVVGCAVPQVDRGEIDWPRPTPRLTARVNPTIYDGSASRADS